MIFTSVTKSDAFYEFEGEDGKLFAPASAIVIIDDESGAKSIRSVGSRKNLGLLKIENDPQ